MVEYALIIALIAVFSIAALTYFANIFNNSLIAKICLILEGAANYIVTGLGQGGGETPPPEIDPDAPSPG